MALVIGSVPHGFGVNDDDPSTAVLIPLPPQNGGAIGWGNVFLSFGADFGASFGDSKLRVAIFNTNYNAWRLETVEPKTNAGRVNVNILDGDSKVSVKRVKNGAGDLGNNPIGWMLETTLRAV